MTNEEREADQQIKDGLREDIGPLPAHKFYRRCVARAICYWLFGSLSPYEWLPTIRRYGQSD